MKFSSTIFASKLARRIFLVFCLCALIPVGGLTVISYQHVSRQLDDQFLTRLKQSVKTYSLFLYERFLILETELSLAAQHLRQSPEPSSTAIQKSYLEGLQKRFTAMVLVKESAKLQVLFGRTGTLEFNEKESKHLKTGNALVKVANNSSGQPELWMIVLLDSQRPAAGFLAAHLDPVYLLALNSEFHLPADVGLYINDDSQEVLFSSFKENESLAQMLSRKIVGHTTGNFEVEWENEVYLTCFRWIFMQPKFLFPGLNITFFQSKTDAFLQIVEFQKIFPKVILLSLLVIIILSLYFIRKSLEPLKILEEGTRQIADSNFNHRVEIDSRDEFEDLAQAFNQMAVQLNNQIKTLESNAQITHAVLSSLETRKILETVISRLTDCFSCEAVSIGLVDSRRPDSILCYIAAKQVNQGIRKIDRKLLPRDLVSIHNNREHLTIERNQDLPDYLSIFDGEGIDAYLILPIFLDARLSAVITLAYRNMAALEYDRHSARQTADQVAVALSNSRLMEQLNRLNWGTIKALARAVDAKSSWTAGHSERVTALSVKLAEAMLLEPGQREDLKRAALLHDIGKIGVPAAILDKPGKLSDQEYEIIKTHPRTGARILEPIEEYTAIIPMVLQHHERYDGQGYPDGLAGNAIHPGARILAVADVFDAMKSDRPYRKGMPLERVLKIIQEESGRQFDPMIVEALIGITTAKTMKAA